MGNAGVSYAKIVIFHCGFHLCYKVLILNKYAVPPPTLIPTHPHPTHPMASEYFIIFKTCRETTMPVLPDHTGPVIDSRGSCVPHPWMIPLYLITEVSSKLEAI